MELTDQRQLAELLIASEELVRHSEPRMTKKSAGLPEVYQPPVHKQNRKRCTCGTCPKCSDNARWERIFKEKFADPLYYVRREIRHESALTEF